MGIQELAGVARTLKKKENACLFVLFVFHIYTSLKWSDNDYHHHYQNVGVERRETG